MCAAIIDSILPRGQTDNDSTKIGRIVHALFNAAREQPPIVLSWHEIWAAGWPKEYEEHRHEHDAGLIFGEKIRSTVYKVRKALERFSASPKGRTLRHFAVLPRKTYRLEFYKNQPDLFCVKPMRPVEHKTTIGLLFGREEEWFQGDLIAGAEPAARTEGYRLLVTFNSMDRQSWRPDNLKSEAEQIQSFSQQCAGLIVVPSIDEYVEDGELFAEPYQGLLDARYPFVFADRRAYCNAPLIASANESGGSMATKFLVSDCRCKAIIVVVEAESKSALERLQGHFNFMRELYGEGFSPLIATEDERWPSDRHFRKLMERELVP